MFIGFGSLIGFTALASAAQQSLSSVTGVILLFGMASAYLRLGRTGLAAGVWNVPAIKDLGQALAPAVLAIGIPGMQQHVLFGPFAAAFIAVFCLSLMVHTLRHLHAFQKDRVLGREILPVAIGSRATRWVALSLLVVGIGSLICITLYSANHRLVSRSTCNRQSKAIPSIPAPRD
jgi:4-hydroxybenzoate polyprenyltransferase